MKVLIACETSGAVRRAFANRGHDAVSCDLLPAVDGDVPEHVVGDAIACAIESGPWDLIIAHPPCTYLSASGLHWNKRDPSRAARTEEALEFARWWIEEAPKHARYVCVENPVGCIGTRIKPATQYVQPYEFGHDASKRTGLWLHNLPPLRPTRHVSGRPVIDPRSGRWVERWANQTDSGQNRLPPSPDRWKKRSETFTGIAAAMAAQWGALPVA